jgi:hypothetical protein
MTGSNAMRMIRYLVSLSLTVTLLGGAAPALAAQRPLEEVKALIPFWQANAPLCTTPQQPGETGPAQRAPSAEDCHDGDMTLFNGLLCASGVELGCTSVRDAQDSSGRWHRSVRYARYPALRPTNSFSWDMAIGVQLYAATKADGRVALGRWLRWVEESRPCIVRSPAIDGKKYCLIRGIPRWCTDDTEMGCTAKPNDLATLATTVRALQIPIPPPTETKLPNGWQGEVLKPLVKEASAANAALSLQKLLEATGELQPSALMIDAAVNREGFPRHLVGAEILLMRRIGRGSEPIDQSALLLAAKEPQNPFYQYLAHGPTDAVANQLLAVAPRSQADLPVHRSDWTWQRAWSDEAWHRAKLWDFVFMGQLLSVPPRPNGDGVKLR